jgi:hypothetical protein
VAPALDAASTAAGASRRRGVHDVVGEPLEQQRLSGREVRSGDALRFVGVAGSDLVDESSMSTHR